MTQTINVRVWNGRYPAYWDGEQVRVLDPIAGYYTSCHSLTPAQVAYVKRMTAY